MTLDLGREVRIASKFEIRSIETSDGLVEFRGYGSVTGVPYEVAGGPDMGGWVETMSKGAFKRTLGTGENRALLYSHDHSRVLATTRAGTLSLSEDNVGLHVAAQLNSRVGWVNDLVQQIEDGTVDEMSIGFYALNSKWSKDYNERSINEVRLLEATITWAGANGATLATIERSRSCVNEARAKSGVDRVAIAARAAAASLRLH